MGIRTRGSGEEFGKVARQSIRLKKLQCTHQIVGFNDQSKPIPQNTLCHSKHRISTQHAGLRILTGLFLTLSDVSSTGSQSTPLACVSVRSSQCLEIASHLERVRAGCDNGNIVLPFLESLVSTRAPACGMLEFPHTIHRPALSEARHGPRGSPFSAWRIKKAALR